MGCIEAGCGMDVYDGFKDYSPILQIRTMEDNESRHRKTDLNQYTNLDKTRIAY